MHTYYEEVTESMFSPQCNTGSTKVTCSEQSADSCSANDGSGKCLCGTNDQCSGATPKCDTTTSPAGCVACDASFCTQPLPWCVPAGTTGEGSCQCGSSADCGTTDQTGNICTASDATGMCMCGTNPVCTADSTVAACLNSAVPPVFVAGDDSSTCKCSGTSCSTASTGVVPSNGACSATAGKN